MIVYELEFPPELEQFGRPLKKSHRTTKRPADHRLRNTDLYNVEMKIILSYF
jgi:hypothetical protein